MNDLRTAVRSLRRRPGFAAVVVVTLALGVGATTAILAVVHGVLLRPLPYQEPDRLVRPTWVWRGADWTDGLTATQYLFWKEHARSFSHVAGFVARPGAGFNLLARGEPAFVQGQFASSDLFPTLGVAPMLGRGFLPEDERPGAPPVAILSYGMWRQRFGSDREVIGQSISIDGTGHTVVGVMPQAFRFGATSADIWLPLQVVADPRDQGHNTDVIARLRPGVSLDQAQAEMPDLLAAFRRQFPGHVGDDEQGVVLRRYRELLVGAGVRGTLLLLFGAAGLVLLIAAVNAASLFLGRAVARRQEVITRAALGAGPWALARPLVAESLLLSVVGGAAGLLLAGWSLDALLALTPRDLPLADQVRIDPTILVIAVGLALVTGVAAAILPALRAPRGNLQQWLHGADRALGGTRQPVRSALVATEIALSTVLVVGAGLVIASLAELWAVRPGFEPLRLWAVQMSLPPEKYRDTEQVWRFESLVMERFAALPGVSAVATASSLPLERGLNAWVAGFRDGERVDMMIEGRVVSPGYFQTLGVPVLAGRSFTDTDARDAAPVVVINEELAGQLWPDASAIGQRVNLYGLSGGVAEVVGVVGNVREFGLDRSPPKALYLPVAQMSDRFLPRINRSFLTSWLIRSATPMDLASVRRAVAEVDPTQPIVSVRTMQQVIEGWLTPRRFVGSLLNVFAGVALLLASIGIFGVVSYTVSQRTREFGLRTALGATQTSLVSLVLGQGARLALIGVVAGLVAGLGVTRFLRSLLFGVTPAEPGVFIAAGLALGMIAVIASGVPAWRAARVDPMAALRYE